MLIEWWGPQQQQPKRNNNIMAMHRKRWINHYSLNFKARVCSIHVSFSFMIQMCTRTRWEWMDHIYLLKSYIFVLLIWGAVRDKLREKFDSVVFKGTDLPCECNQLIITRFSLLLLWSIHDGDLTSCLRLHSHC